MEIHFGWSMFMESHGKVMENDFLKRVVTLCFVTAQLLIFTGV